MANHNLQKNTALIKPRVTEKAALSADKRNVYVFVVKKGATKSEISASIREAYKVTPEKIRLVSIPSKKVVYRGKRGTKGGGKKAYVYLRKEDKIEII